MKPVDMIVKHEPPASIGDCFRCCIASLLEKPAVAVPHFMERDYGKTEGCTWLRDLNAWLKPLDLTYIDLSITPEQHRDGWFKNIEPEGVEVFHVLSGASRRAEHSTVARNGVIVHDPAPQRDGLIGPADDGLYHYGVLIARNGA